MGNTCKYRVGIDIGGTKVNIGLVKQDGSIVDNAVFLSTHAHELDVFTEEVAHTLERLLDKNGISLDRISHIGVGIPGTADTLHGIVEYSCNLFGKSVPLGAALEKRLHCPVCIIQDSWAAAWAEHLFGAGRGWDHIMCVTVGTGIGCGVILNDRVFSGAMHTAGELGHTPIIRGGRLCSCGRRGCLEAYSSGSAIWAQAMERFPDKLKNFPQRTESVFQMAYEGCKEALELISECVDNLAYGLAIGMNLLAVDTVIISGGLCIHRDLFINPLKEKILSYGYPAWTDTREIRVYAAELGANAPMVGAAFLEAKYLC